MIRSYITDPVVAAKIHPDFLLEFLSTRNRLLVSHSESVFSLELAFAHLLDQVFLGFQLQSVLHHALPVNLE